MRKIIFALIIVHCTLILGITQSGWYQLQTGTSGYFRDVYFINEFTGWVVSDSSRVLMTTNGGVNWNIQQIYSNPFPALYTTNFVNNLTGYTGGGINAAGFGMKYLFKTTNGGMNWFTVNIDGSMYDYMWYSSISIINSDIIFAATSAQYSLGGSGGDVRKSTNGGLNFASGYGNGAHKSVYFINEQTGWTVSNYSDDVGTHKCYIHFTTNSGSNWTMQFKDTINYIRLSKIHFFNSNTGYAIGLNSSPVQVWFFKTTNSGLNWNYSTITSGKGTSMYFVDINTGWICGNSFGDTSAIARTTNGGQNWISQRKGIFESIEQIYFVNSLTGYAVGSGGKILKTTTGGVTFAAQISTTIPEKFSLYQNYPNPFNPVTKIRFDIPQHTPYPLSRGETSVTLKVFDILGKEITTLVNEELQPGTYEVTLDGSNLPSGIYFYQLRSGEYLETKKLVLLK